MNFFPPPRYRDDGEDHHAMIQQSESDRPLIGPRIMAAVGNSAAAPAVDAVASRPRPEFSFRKVTLDGPVAPLLAHPTAPFGKSRKKAFMAASYYSECFLNGITPVDADTAAAEAQSRYDKWWKSTTYSNQPQLRPGKRQKLLEHDQQKLKQQTPSSALNNMGQQLIPNPSLEAITYQRKLSLEGSVVSSSEEDASAQRQSRKQSVSSSSSSSSSPSSSPSSVHRLHHHRPHKRQLVLDSDIDVIHACPSRSFFDQHEIHRAKAALVQDLKSTGGDTRSSKFLSCLNFLEAVHTAQGCDARWNTTTTTSQSQSQQPQPCTSDGAWLNLTKPTFSECLGQNEKGQCIYTLGRLAFDMFRPTNLRCILRGVFNAVGLPSEDDGERPRSFPSGMHMPIGVVGAQQQQGSPVIRNNDIVVSFTIEANQTRRGQPVDASQQAEATSGDEYIVRRPIRGLLTNHGYCVPDPDVKNRLSVWFSGGSLEVQDEVHDLDEWKRLFDENEAPRRDLGELARVLAARCLLGAHLPHSMEEDGSLTYFLKRPIGGHSQVFVDVLYCDETLRIVRGHRGSIYASIRSL